VADQVDLLRPGLLEDRLDLREQLCRPQLVGAERVDRGGEHHGTTRTKIVGDPEKVEAEQPLGEHDGEASPGRSSRRGRIARRPDREGYGNQYTGTKGSASHGALSFISEPGQHTKASPEGTVNSH
jgi:hypothetical protein